MNLLSEVKLNNLDTKHETKRSWWVVEFDVDPQHEEMASWLMIQLGANGCQLTASQGEMLTLQASFEPHLISPDRLEPVYAALDEYGLAYLAVSLRVRQIEEEDWLAEWKRGMEPVKLGERFVVSPPWFKNQIPERDLAGRLVIWIEPGMAFGTGFHFTTQFCLRAIEKHLGAGSILDVGTGSGILAIGAALLFPDSQILALETDPLALRVASENVLLNQVGKQVQLLEGSTEKVSGRAFNAILSNLTFEDNLALLPEYGRLLVVGGKAVLTGILVEKLPLIEEALSRNMFRILEKEMSDIWVGLVVEAGSQ